MCTQFPRCFLILSQYLTLVKKGSNFQKNLNKRFIHYTFKILILIFLGGGEGKFKAFLANWDRMRKHQENCVHIRQFKFNWSDTVFFHIITGISQWTIIWRTFNALINQITRLEFSVVEPELPYFAGAGAVIFVKKGFGSGLAKNRYFY